MATKTYIYESKLSYMFILAKENDSPSGVMDSSQTLLWETIQENIKKVKDVVRTQRRDEAVEQYFVELWSWEALWPGVPFPGVFPKFVDSSAWPVTTSCSDVHPALIQQLQRNEIADRATLRTAILKYKKKNGNATYEPQHGWDTQTGLPRYSIVVKGKDCWKYFCGHEKSYISAVQKHFSNYRIMFQRASNLDNNGPDNNLLVIWLEAVNDSVTQQLRDCAWMWNSFRELWAFFKSWAKEFSSGHFIDIFAYLRETHDMSPKFPHIDTSGLLPPAPPSSFSPFGSQAANYPGNTGGSLSLSESENATKSCNTGSFLRSASQNYIKSEPDNYTGDFM